MILCDVAVVECLACRPPRDSTIWSLGNSVMTPKVCSPCLEKDILALSLQERVLYQGATALCTKRGTYVARKTFPYTEWEVYQSHTVIIIYCNEKTLTPLKNDSGYRVDQIRWVLDTLRTRGCQRAQLQQNEILTTPQNMTCTTLCCTLSASFHRTPSVQRYTLSRDLHSTLSPQRVDARAEVCTCVDGIHRDDRDQGVRTAVPNVRDAQLSRGCTFTYFLKPVRLRRNAIMSAAEINRSATLTVIDAATASHYEHIYRSVRRRRSSTVTCYARLTAVVVASEYSLNMKLIGSLVSSASPHQCLGATHVWAVPIGRHQWPQKKRTETCHMSTHPSR